MPQLPAKKASPRAVIEKSFIANRSQAETPTANTVITAAITRCLVINVFAPPLNANLSTQSEIPVWPARDATVKSATPAIGTTYVCIATNEAPNAPAAKVQGGILLTLTASNI